MYAYHSEALDSLAAKAKSIEFRHVFEDAEGAPYSALLPNDLQDFIGRHLIHIEGELPNTGEKAWEKSIQFADSDGVETKCGQMPTISEDWA